MADFCTRLRETNPRNREETENSARERRKNSVDPGNRRDVVESADAVWRPARNPQRQRGRWLSGCRSPLRRRRPARAGSHSVCARGALSVHLADRLCRTSRISGTTRADRVLRTHEISILCASEAPPRTVRVEGGSAWLVTMLFWPRSAGQAILDGSKTDSLAKIVAVKMAAVHPFGWRHHVKVPHGR